jgi:hypothetical protein
MAEDMDRRGIDRKLLVVCALPIFSLATALLGSPTVATADPPDALLTFQAVGAIALINLWVVLDAREREFRVSWLLWLSLIGLTCVVLPYYLFRSRGTASGFRAIGWALGVFAITMLFYHFGSRVAAGV